MDAFNAKTFDTVQVKYDRDICFLQIYRPEDNNAINDDLVKEVDDVLDQCEESIKIIVLEGLPEVFCFGADFKRLQERFDNHTVDQAQNPEPLYDVWMRLATGPFISIAHVQGKANAGGIGFVAACDVVISDEKALFSLSEQLFGLIPACVLPFLIRRIGFSKANYMTLTTLPVSAKQASEWGLVDAYGENSANLLKKHLLRLRRLSKKGISRYKQFVNELNETLMASKPKALRANMEVFSDNGNLEKIARYVKTGQFPWEEA